MLPLSGFKWTVVLLSLQCLVLLGVNVRAEIEYNTLNEDGSYSFRHSNDDIGGYYHSASGSPDNIVRGRYGSRNPASGQLEEVVYTAGPRGFRANGPKLHRKMDLAQYPPRAIGSPDDPLADPYDDPSYSFSFRTSDQSRSENSESTGRVRGLYSYLDDVGERHSVRYAAGAGTGFEVSNAVPDNPASVGYTAPLYKAHPKTRGKMTVQRGPNGSYKLIVAGPDHRRAESRGTDGLVRGTYSYLDDKGVQRTVEYIAGAGIGYRIVQNKIGPGTHINPSVSDFRLNDGDFRLANDFGRGAGAGSLGVGDDRGGDGGGGGGGGRPGGGDSRSGSGYASSIGSDRVRPESNSANRGRGGSGGEGRNGGSGSRTKSDRMGISVGSRGGTRYHSGGADSEDNSYNGESTRDSAKFGSRAGNRPSSNRNSVNTGDGTRNRLGNGVRNSAGGSSSRRGEEVAGGGGGDDNNGYNYDAPTSENNYNFKDDEVGSLPPLITPNRKILEIDRERDWVQRHHDSTLIRNVGKWYIGLPPGQSVRAHVQNIDLVPLGGRRVLSPSEALRQDEIADMVASLESEASHTS